MRETDLDAAVGCRDDPSAAQVLEVRGRGDELGGRVDEEADDVVHVAHGHLPHLVLVLLAVQVRVDLPTIRQTSGAVLAIMRETWWEGGGRTCSGMACPGHRWRTMTSMVTSLSTSLLTPAS